MSLLNWLQKLFCTRAIYWTTHDWLEPRHICSWARTGCHHSTYSGWWDMKPSLESNNCHRCNCSWWQHTWDSPRIYPGIRSRSSHRWNIYPEQGCYSWSSTKSNILKVCSKSLRLLGPLRGSLGIYGFTTKFLVRRGGRLNMCIVQDREEWLGSKNG